MTETVNQAMLPMVIAGIMPLLQRRIDEHGADVQATLQKVADGKLPVVEALQPQELQQLRTLCGFIAQKGVRDCLHDAQNLISSMGKYESAHLAGPLLAWLKEFSAADNKTKMRFALLLISYIFYEDFHYPQPETGVYDIAGNPFEKLKWLYRYWLNQLEVAERHSQLEEFFAQQSIDLSDPFAHLLPSTARHTVSLSCGGDLLAVDVLTPEHTMHLFDDITDFYSHADLVCANLESTVDESRYIGRFQAPGQPAQMNTSVEMFKKFRYEAGINYFSTATNHAMDWGEAGVKATLEVLRQSGAYYSGTAASQSEQDHVLVIEKNGIKIALLAFTFDLNGYTMPADKTFLVNMVRFNDANPEPDYHLVRQQVAAAKAKGAEHIVAFCHWGWEFEMYPHVNIVQAAHDIIACGVDTILGNHPHVSQPAQLIERPDLPPALVVYAFGDFVSYHPESRNSKFSYLIKFDIIKYKDALLGTIKNPPARAFVANVLALPIYIVNAQQDDGQYDCRILRFETVLENPDAYGLTELEKSQLPHLRDKLWHGILSGFTYASR